MKLCSSENVEVNKAGEWYFVSHVPFLPLPFFMIFFFKVLFGWNESPLHCNLWLLPAPQELGFESA